MKSGVDVVIDFVLLLLVLMAGVPPIMLCTEVFLIEKDFGMGLTRDKSVVSTPAQERNLFGDSYLESRKYLTDAHMMFMPVIDDSSSGSRTIHSLRLSHTGSLVRNEFNYVCSKDERLSRNTLIKEAADALEVSAATADDAQYHITLAPEAGPPNIPVGTVQPAFERTAVN